MELIDLHIHLWSPDSHPFVVDPNHPAHKFVSVERYMVDEYKKDTQGHNVVKCVHVETAWPGDPVGETIWLSELADNTGIPNAIVGYCDLSSGEIEGILKRHLEHKRVRGIRQTLNFSEKHPEFSTVSHDDYLTDPNWIRGFALLEKYDLSFELHILPGQMKRAVNVVREHPGVRVMLAHCGMPVQTYSESMREWKDGLTQLAKSPNVYAKVSGMFLSSPTWNQTSLHESHVVKSVLEIFGIDRCVFASNFPVDKINGSYTQLLEALEPILSAYSQEDQQKFYAGNARKFYRL